MDDKEKQTLTEPDVVEEAIGVGKPDEPETNIKSGAIEASGNEPGNTEQAEAGNSNNTGAEKASADSPKKASSGKKKRKKKTAGQLAAAFFIKIAVTFIVLWIVFNYVAAIYVNHKHSSYPMIKDGDLCLVYRLGKLEEGAAVAYERNGEICFGRIAAKAGDTVDIRGDVLTVNGMNVIEDVVYPTTSEGSTIEYPYTVPADSYFILNDYRAEVTDSRAGGAINKDSIKGRIIFIMRRRGI